jgi:ribosomal-protein-alanine N-acetyltransferase
MEKHDSLEHSEVEIHTERLLLKPLSLEWRDTIFTEFTPEITTFMFPDSPKEVGETEGFITSTMENMAMGKELVLAILDSNSGEFLGCAGLHNMDTKTPEFGIWLKKTAHGKKYGQEAITALKQWADQHVPYEYLVYPVDRDNIASRKIPESFGGIVHAEYDKPTPSGKILHSIEYRIYPS